MKTFFQGLGLALLLAGSAMPSVTFGQAPAALNVNATAAGLSGNTITETQVYADDREKYRTFKTACDAVRGRVESAAAAAASLCPNQASGAVPACKVVRLTCAVTVNPQSGDATTVGSGSQTGPNSFIPLTNLPGLTRTINSDSLPTLFNTIYKLCIGAAAVIAILQIMRAGTKFFFNKGSVAQNEEGKRLIQNSILGLLLVLSPAIVFGIINRDILNLNLDVSSLQRGDPNYVDLTTEEGQLRALSNSSLASALRDCGVTISDPQQNTCLNEKVLSISRAYTACIRSGESGAALSACNAAAQQALATAAGSGTGGCNTSLRQSDLSCIVGKITTDLSAGDTSLCINNQRCALLRRGYHSPLQDGDFPSEYLARYGEFNTSCVNSGGNPRVIPSPPWVACPDDPGPTYDGVRLVVVEGEKNCVRANLQCDRVTASSVLSLTVLRGARDPLDPDHVHPSNRSQFVALRDACQAARGTASAALYAPWRQCPGEAANTANCIRATVRCQLPAQR